MWHCQASDISFCGYWPVILKSAAIYLVSGLFNYSLLYMFSVFGILLVSHTGALNSL